MNKEPADFITFIVAIFSWFVGREVGGMLALYAAIVVISATGASFSLLILDEQKTGWQSLKYVFIRIMIAVTLTVSIAKLVNLAIPSATPNNTLIPICFCIGVIHDYKNVFAWAGGLLRTVLERIANRGQQ